jgi:large subunit ribosomal protein L2
MPIRKYKPTSAGRRFQSVQTFDDITTSEPYKPLVETLERSGGRNNHGHLTSWWRGGGHKRNYRIIDFKRDKTNIPGKVSTVEYDPNRTARIALVTYADGEKRYILHPIGLKVGDTVWRGQRRHPPGQLPAAQEHSTRHDGAQRGIEEGQGRPDRAVGGSSVQVVAKEGLYASVKMPSGEIRLINIECLATVGQVGNSITRTCRSARPAGAAGSASGRTCAVSR